MSTLPTPTSDQRDHILEAALKPLPDSSRVAEMVQRTGTQMVTGGTDAGKEFHSFLSDLALGVG